MTLPSLKCSISHEVWACMHYTPSLNCIDVRTCCHSWHCVQVMAYPHQNYSVPIGAFDEYGQPTAGVFSVREEDVSMKMNVRRLSCYLIWA